MKRFVLKISFLLVAIVGLYCFQKKENNTVKNLAFENIEALAAGEGGRVFCMGSGSVDCNGSKYEIKYSGFSLGNE